MTDDHASEDAAAAAQLTAATMAARPPFGTTEAARDQVLKTYQFFVQKLREPVLPGATD